MMAAGFVLGMRPLVALVMVAMAATATRARRLFVVIVLVLAGFVVDRRVGDAIENQILLDLLHLRGRATLLGVQTTRTTGTTGRTLLVAIRIVMTVVIMTAPTLVAIIARVLFGIAATATTATRRTFLLIGIVGALRMVGRAFLRPGVVGILVTHTGNRRQHRFLEQQRHHRTGIVMDLMALRQRLHGVQRALHGRLIAARLRGTATGTPRRTFVILAFIGKRATTATARNILFLVIIRTTTRRAVVPAVVIGKLRDVAATATRRTVFVIIPASGTGRIRHVIGDIGRIGRRPGTRLRKLRLLEQRRRGMLLDLQFERGARRAHATHHAAAATTATRTGIGIC